MNSITDNETLLLSIVRIYKQCITSDEDAADLLYTFLAQQDLKCICGCKNRKRRKGARFFDCTRCGLRIYFTSGTIFEGVSRLAAWIGTVTLIGNGVAVSANRLSRIFGIAQSTALNMYKKILTVLTEELEATSLKAFTQMFNSIINKRSRESGSDQHPVVACGSSTNINGSVSYEHDRDEIDSENFMKDFMANFMADSEENNAAKEKRARQEAGILELDPDEANIFDLFGDEEKSVDTIIDDSGYPTGKVLSVLTVLEMYELIECTSADRYRRVYFKDMEVKTKQSQNPFIASDLRERAQRIINHIHTYFHGVSRKYLQLYLVAYCAFSDRKRCSARALLKRCLEHKPISDLELFAMRSTRFVNVAHDMLVLPMIS